jgi:hypothetical protein
MPVSFYDALLGAISIGTLDSKTTFPASRRSKMLHIFDVSGVCINTSENDLWSD